MTKAIIASVIMESVTIMASVTYGKSYLWQMYYGKCIMAKNVWQKYYGKWKLKLSPFKADEEILLSDCLF